MKGHGYATRKWLTYILLGVLSITILLPFLWMVSSSLKTSQEVFSVPMRWLPEKTVWKNFQEIWTKIPLILFFKNSFKLAIIITVLQVLTSGFAAYPFAKMAGRRFFTPVVRQMFQFCADIYVHAAQGIFLPPGLFFQFSQIAPEFSRAYCIFIREVVY